MTDRLADAYRPPLGIGLTAALIIAAVAVAVWCYVRRDRDVAGWRRGVLLTLRLSAIAAAAWLLAGPSVRVPGAASDVQPRVVLLADTSRSMSVDDVVIDGRHMSRWDAVRLHWLDGDLGSLRGRADVRIVGFDERSREMSIDDAKAMSPQGRATHLMDALNQLASRPHTAAAVAVVLSDGRDTEVGEDAGIGRRLREAGWRTFAVPVGSRMDGADLAVHAWADAARLFDGQTTAIRVQITQRGFAGHRVAVELYHDGQLVQTRVMDAPPAGSTRLSFDVRPRARPGDAVTLHGYEIALRSIDTPAPVERVSDNNRRHVFMEVTRQKLRIAMFEGEPYWDTRFLARQLREDPQVELVSHIRISPQRTVVQRSDDALAAMGDNLAGYDVVILGRGVEAFFPGEQATQLVDYVRQGGALVLARGRPFGMHTPEGRVAADIVAPIEPIEWGQGIVGDLRVRLTAGGERSTLLADIAPQLSAAVTRLPDLIAATVVRGPRAASIVLLEQSPQAQGGPAMAAVSYQRVGEGRVFAVLGDGLWRWAFTARSLAADESVYAMFWSRAIRWLAAGGEFLPGQTWSLQLSRLAVEPGEAVGVTVASRYPVAEGVPFLRATSPDGTAHDVPLSRSAPGSQAFVGAVTPTMAGVHTLRLHAAGEADVVLTSKLAAYGASTEMLDTSARPEVLKALAESTGGTCLDLDDTQTIVRILDEARAAATTPDRIEYAIDRPAVFAAIVLGLGLEWLLRRRSGLA